MNDSASCKALIIYEPPKRKIKLLSLFKQLELMLSSALKTKKYKYVASFAIHVFIFFLSYSMCCVDYGLFSVFNIIVPHILHTYILCTLFVVFLLSFTVYGKAVSFVFSVVFPFCAGVLMYGTIFNLATGYLSIVCAVFLCAVLVFSSIIITVETSVFSVVFTNKRLNGLKASRCLSFVCTYFLFSLVIFLSLFYF